VSYRPCLAVLLLLAACGKQGQLTPVPPRTMPPAPAAASVAPTPDEMLQLPPQAVPRRVDNQNERSIERPDDRFNLPPSGTN
jgi:predicted small lipoprotein YifL